MFARRCARHQSCRRNSVSYPFTASAITSCLYTPHLHGWGFVNFVRYFHKSGMQGFAVSRRRLGEGPRGGLVTCTRLGSLGLENERSRGRVLHVLDEIEPQSSHFVRARLPGGHLAIGDHQVMEKLWAARVFPEEIATCFHQCSARPCLSQASIPEVDGSPNTYIHAVVHVCEECALKPENVNSLAHLQVSSCLSSRSANLLAPRAESKSCRRPTSNPRARAPQTTA